MMNAEVQAGKFPKLIQAAIDAFNLPDLRAKILFTLAILALYRFIAHIPLPGIDQIQLDNLFRNNELLGFLDLFSGGALSRMSIVALGVFPYITSSIIIQLLTPVIPMLQDMSREGESGRAKINRLTHYITIPIAFAQGYGQLVLLEQSNVIAFARECLGGSAAYAGSGSGNNNNFAHAALLIDQDWEQHWIGWVPVWQTSFTMKAVRSMAENTHYDVIVIGSGPGGAALAQRLAPTGKHILILERGDYLPREEANWNARAVFVEGRYQADEHWVNKDGDTFVPQLHYNVGGNSKVYGAALFRLRERDFDELEHAGGVSPAWPLSYTDLAPW